MKNLAVIEREDFDNLKEEIATIMEYIMDQSENCVIDPEWYTLAEACKKKGITLKTVYNRIELQPNGGTPDGKIGGRKKWRKSTIEKWITIPDEDIL